MGMRALRILGISMASNASRVRAFSILKESVWVRLSWIRWAPQPSFSPMSWARVLT